MRKKTNVLIAGPYRSGSTAVYNLTRAVCFQYGTVYGCFEDVYSEEEADGSMFEVIKTHKYKPDLVEWADVIITVFREPLEMWDSMQRFKPGEFEVLDVLRSLSWLVHYNLHADYMINFEQIERCPEKLAEQIAFRIGFKVRAKRVVELFKAIVPPKTGYDPVTLLHANHRTQ